MSPRSGSIADTEERLAVYREEKRKYLERQAEKERERAKRERELRSEVRAAREKVGDGQTLEMYRERVAETVDDMVDRVNYWLSALGQLEGYYSRLRVTSMARRLKADREMLYRMFRDVAGQDEDVDSRRILRCKPEWKHVGEFRDGWVRVPVDAYQIVISLWSRRFGAQSRRLVMDLAASLLISEEDGTPDPAYTWVRAIEAQGAMTKGAA